jgi:hypothetical protein
MTNTPAAPEPESPSPPRWVPPALFAVLTLVVFHRYLFSPPGTMLIGNDTIAAGVMMRSFFVEQFHELGRLPLWNPFLYGGVPTIEAGSGDILYPPAFALHMLLPLVSALAWKLILHVFLAGLAMYACARAYGISRLVALFAGVAWMLSANLVSLVLGGQDGKMYVITLFPAALGLLVAALQRPTLLRFLWLGAVAGLMLIAHPQVSFYAWLTLGLYALGSVVQRRKDGGKLAALRLAGGGLSLAIGLGVALIVLLPMYRYLRDVSPRAGPGLSFETAASYALNPEEVVNFIVPDFSGVNETYWGRNPLKHNSEYGGVVVFALGIAGLIGLKGDRRRLALGLIAGLALLYALGATTPAFRLMYLTIPGLRRFRAPSLATFLALGALAILAALMLERILQDREGPEGRTAARVLAVIGGLALVLGIAVQAGGAGALAPWTAVFGPTPRIQAVEANLSAMALGGVLAALWCGLAVATLAAWRRGLMGATGVVIVLTSITVVDLLRVDAPYIQVAPYSQFFPEDPGLGTLRQQLGPGERVLPGRGVLPGGGPDGGYLATYRIPEVFGYHSNQLRWYDQLTRRDQRDGIRSMEELQAYWIGLLRSPALQALAARVAVLPFKVELPGYELLGSNQQVALYRHTTALPAASIIPGVRVEPDSTHRLDLLWDPAFDVSREALVDAPVPSVGAGGGTGTARIAGDGADSVAIEATTNGPAILLVSRTWHPSWRAVVDDKVADIVRVDHALIGVPLAAAGTHQVTLRYRPAIVREARAVSMATWVIVILATIVTGGLTLQEARRRG